MLALEVYAKADPVADRAAADTIGTHVLAAMSHVKRTEFAGPESALGNAMSELVRSRGL